MEEKKCETFFNLTPSRDPSGRYVVHLPFKDNVGSVGSTRELAMSRFKQLERRFKSNPNLKKQYYISL